ncbi:MAG: LptA/OstA family protein [Thermovirgaceae bacterium]|nr:LptA/OstA family protein [Thermovirgaceae bacterium]
MKKFASLFGAALVLLLAVSVPVVAEQMRLTSDTLNYDPSSGLIKASGNVRVLGKGTEITSLFGEFDAGGKRSHLWDEVLADWTEGAMTLDCADLVIVEEPGGQHLTARSVKRFHDSVRKITMRSSLMEGTLRGGEFSDLVATGNVVADAVAADGAPIRVTGSKAVYSKAKDTMIFTGSAVATQKNRTLTAETFTIHLESGRIEAVGNPQMVVDLPAGEGK